MRTQAYFDDIQLHILHELRKASTSIHIAVAWFTDLEIFDHLCQKAREGVRVELIVVNDAINRRSPLEYKRLADLGGLFLMVGDKKKRSAIMHNKFCVIDGATVITGSYNWSRQAQENWENITIISDHPELAQQFLLEFEAIIEQHAGRGGGGVDQGKIISRLEALRHVIELDDDDDTHLQLTKLKRVLPVGDEFAEVRKIIALVEEAQHEQAVNLISSFVSCRKQVMVYTDPEIPELTLELKALEIQITALEDEKAEIEKTLHTFNYRYNIEVGDIVRQILKLRQERLKTEAEGHEEKHREYEEAKQDYEEFEQGFQQARQQELFAITDAEQQELKAIFRACSKMCHPDVVATEHQQEATMLFAQLSAAYEKNDIAAVKEIYERLRKGIFTPMSATVSDAQKLHWQIVRMRGKLKDMAVAIYELRKTDAWRKVTVIEDWDAYFAQLKQQFQAELDATEAQ
jgi:hypothetical protein